MQKEFEQAMDVFANSKTDLSTNAREMLRNNLVNQVLRNQDIIDHYRVLQNEAVQAQEE